MSERQLRIEPRFCGPPECGNGGYVAGLLAEGVEGACEVTLRAPAPLARDLELRTSGDGRRELWDGETLLASARSIAPLELQVPDPPEFAEVEKRAGSCRAFATHPFPHCFVCGPAREPGDGLRVFPGWHAELGLAAAPWQPDPALADASGRVALRFVWAALDSPSAFPLLEPADAVRLEPLVLGRLALEQRHDVVPGARHVVTAWSLGIEGRRGHAGCALHDEAGRLCALARATWVSLAR
jgi:hypothetical protein